MVECVLKKSLRMFLYEANNLSGKPLGIRGFIIFIGKFIILNTQFISFM